MQQQATDAAAGSAGHTIATAGASVAVWAGWIDPNVVAAVGGLLIGAIGLAVQIYYKRRAERRDIELHAAQMAELERDGRAE